MNLNASNWVKGQIIVDLHNNIRGDVLNSFFSDFADFNLKENEYEMSCVRFNTRLLKFDYTTIDEFILLELIRQDPRVNLAQFNNYLNQHGTEPIDPMFNEQWSLKNTGQDDGIP